jgi:hypothetical protein
LTEKNSDNVPVTAVLWIHIGFNAGQDPAFYLNADPEPGIQTMRINGYGFWPEKVEFLMKYT